MAAKNSIKQYLEDSYYHLYNRGVEKRGIFLDKQDFAVFLSYLKTYLLPKDEAHLKAILSSPNSTPAEKALALRDLRLKNFSQDISLLAYSLMPNHFHFLVHQTNADAIDRFLNSLATRYTIYFNKKYHRVGPLYQGVYKAVLVTTDEQLLHLSRYVHLNPLSLLSVPTDRWSDVTLPFSLPEYLGARKTPWIKPEAILNYFNKTSKNNSYSSFMGAHSTSEDAELVSPIALDYSDS
ncbi:MAG: hypothetical protein UY21_C0014G0024 [Microgenomates group bacterium GW2011_GWA1_48_10]|nr:MAG: hypothetical protein UY21_C0014G0024 [Microgenomates group bacterium GW2011_GWA1_48_10]